MLEPMFSACTPPLSWRTVGVATVAVSKLASHRLQRLTDDATLTDTVQAAEDGGVTFKSCSSLGVCK